MTKIVKNISVDVAAENALPAIVAKQYDNNSRFITARLTNEGDYIDVSPTSGVYINACREDKEAKGFAGVVNDDGTVTVPLTSWMLELDGRVECDISVIDADGRKLSSTPFGVNVVTSAYGGSDITEDENYDILVELIAEVNELKQEVEVGDIFSQGRSAKYNLTSGGWKRILNIIRGSNGTINLGCGTGEWLKYHRSLAFDVCGFVKFPEDTNPQSSPLLLKRFENVCGDDDAMAAPPVKITKVRVGYPTKDATFTPINGGTHNYASAPVNCYVDVYVEFDASNLVNKYATFCMNYAGFADSHNCESITEETNAVDVGIYGEELTYFTVTTDDMPYYLKSTQSIPMPESANALKGSASGNPVVLTDVSPLEHQKDVSMSEGGATLRTFGKNLLNMGVFPYFNAPVDGVYTASKYVGTGFQPLNLPAGEYILSANIKSPKGMNYRFRIKDVDGNTYSLLASEAPSNGEFRYQELKVNVNGIVGVSFYHSGNGAGKDEVYVKDAMLELGSTATEFEPFVVGATYTADENGDIKATSIYPTTTLIAENGVTISVEYNKDINKAIENVGENVEPMVESLVTEKVRPRSIGQNTDLSKVKCEYIGEIILKANGFGIGWYDAYICLSISTGLGSEGNYPVYNWSKIN